MAKSIIIICALLLASMITSYGCYTVIKHPSVLGNETQTEGDNHSKGRDCVSCHQDFHEYPYGYYYGYYPDYYWSYPRWGDYYVYPWWWDNYWYNSKGPGDNPVPTEQGTKPATRRGLEPPYVRGIEPIPPPSYNPGGIPPGTVTPGGTTTGGGVDNPPSDKPKEKAKVEDKKPPKRRK